VSAKPSNSVGAWLALALARRCFLSPWELSRRCGKWFLMKPRSGRGCVGGAGCFKLLTSFRASGSDMTKETVFRFSPLVPAYAKQLLVEEGRHHDQNTQGFAQVEPHNQAVNA